jgi:hypothetical protein
MHAVRRIAVAVPLLLLVAATASAEEPKPPESKEAKTPVTTTTDTNASATTSASTSVSFTTADGKQLKCKEQSAQSFLVRGNWFPKTNDPDKVKAARKLLEDAIKYRTEKYGYFEGFGSKNANPHPPKHYAKAVSFMGMSTQVHEKIIPALKCVEAALKANGGANEYKPHAMGGMRFHNTYKGVEVSNHVYGIAVDIEPDRNTCCGCVKPWNEHPLCQDKSKTVWQRMVMPKSWVDTFEKYGFYWLGHDVLQDTMHFEFLGDPDKIVESSAGTAVAASSP